MMVARNQLSLGDKFFTIPFTDNNINQAYNRAAEMGIIKNSILQGKGNWAGFLAEEALASYLDANIDADSSYDYDLLYKGIRIEVKTKRRTVIPKGHYEVSINETSLHQDPDLYVFMQVQFSHTSCRIDSLVGLWVLGIKTPKDFFQTARFVPKGEYDYRNNFTNKANMYNLEIQYLDSLK